MMFLICIKIKYLKLQLYTSGMYKKYIYKHSKKNYIKTKKSSNVKKEFVFRTSANMKKIKKLNSIKKDFIFHKLPSFKTIQLFCSGNIKKVVSLSKQRFNFSNLLLKNKKVYLKYRTKQYYKWAYSNKFKCKKCSIIVFLIKYKKIKSRTRATSFVIKKWIPLPTFLINKKKNRKKINFIFIALNKQKWHFVKFSYKFIIKTYLGFMYKKLPIRFKLKTRTNLGYRTLFFKRVLELFKQRKNKKKIYIKRSNQLKKKRKKIFRTPLKTLLRSVLRKRIQYGAFLKEVKHKMWLVRKHSTKKIRSFKFKVVKCKKNVLVLPNLRNKKYKIKHKKLKLFSSVVKFRKKPKLKISSYLKDILWRISTSRKQKFINNLKTNSKSTLQINLYNKKWKNKYLRILYNYHFIVCLKNKKRNKLKHRVLLNGKKWKLFNFQIRNYNSWSKNKTTNKYNSKNIKNNSLSVVNNIFANKSNIKHWEYTRNDLVNDLTGRKSFVNKKAQYDSPFQIVSEDDKKTYYYKYIKRNLYKFYQFENICIRNNLQQKQKYNLINYKKGVSNMLLGKNITLINTRRSYLTTKNNYKSQVNKLVLKLKTTKKKLKKEKKHRKRIKNRSRKLNVVISRLDSYRKHQYLNRQKKKFFFKNKLEKKIKLSRVKRLWVRKINGLKLKKSYFLKTIWRRYFRDIHDLLTWKRKRKQNFISLNPRFWVNKYRFSFRRTRKINRKIKKPGFIGIYHRYPWLNPIMYKRRLFRLNKRNLFLRMKMPSFHKRNKIYFTYSQTFFNRWTPRIKRRTYFRINNVLGKIILAFYGHLKLKQFKKIVKNNNRLKPINNSRISLLLNKLERRLDVLIYRMNFAPTIQWAREFIRLGTITVDSIVVEKPYYLVKNFALIQHNSLRIYRNKFKYFFNTKLLKKTIPSHLLVNKKLSAGLILYSPDKKLFRNNDRVKFPHLNIIRLSNTLIKYFYYIIKKIILLVMCI